MIIDDFEKCYKKWKPIIDYDIINIKLVEIYCIFMEWKSMEIIKLPIRNGSTELIDIKKDIDEKMRITSSYKEVKLYLNELTGKLEYNIDGLFYNNKNMIVRVDTIINIFGDDFYNFLVERKYEF